MANRNSESNHQPEVVSDLTDQTLADDTAKDVFLEFDLEDDDDSGADDGGGDTATAADAATRRELEEERTAHLRTMADFANFKRRTEEDRESLRQHLTSDLLSRLLPIVDNFERALQAAEQTKDYDKLVTGVNAVYRQLQDYLSREEVKPIEALHEPFDPNLHNAVMRDETTEHPENTVVEELQKGYTHRGRVLRPTMVKVAVGDA